MQPEKSEQKGEYVLPLTEAGLVTGEGGLKLIMPSSGGDFSPEMVLIAAIFHRVHSEEGFAQECLQYLTDRPDEAATYGLTFVGGGDEVPLQ